MGTRVKGIGQMPLGCPSGSPGRDVIRCGREHPARRMLWSGTGDLAATTGADAGQQLSRNIRVGCASSALSITTEACPRGAASTV
ncbi:hypothetical protein ABIE24_002647 [Mycetocola sp. 2940]